MIQLFLLAWLSAQASSPEAMQHMQAGLEARKQQQVTVEIAEFRKATELDSSLADAFANLGRAYMEAHDYGAAIAPLKRALELSPDLPVAHQFLGYALLAQGYAAEAIPHLSRVGAQDALGIAQLETGQLSEAVSTLGSALAKRPNDPDLQYYLGHASGLLSKSSIDTLLAEHPDSARAHQALAENYFVLRQMPQAEKEYLEALRLRPDLPGRSRVPPGCRFAAAGKSSRSAYRIETVKRSQAGNARDSVLSRESGFTKRRQQHRRTVLVESNRTGKRYVPGRSITFWAGWFVP
jgi:tetratricopeptide (TPR) repeat protein